MKKIHKVLILSIISVLAGYWLGHSKLGDELAKAGYEENVKQQQLYDSIKARNAASTPSELR